MPTLEARGVELSWSERGRGEAVLLIHETATTSAAWEPVAAAVADGPQGAPGARAIAYDRRGWGASTAPVGYQRTTVEEQSEDAAALVEALELGPAALCGAGLGAVIALDLLLRRPELVAGAVLVEPPVLALLPEATAALSEDRAELEAAVRDRGGEGAVSLYLSGGLRALGPGCERLPDGLTAEARQRPAGLFAELGAGPAWGMPLRRLGEARGPALILTGASTPPLLREAAGALAARLRGAEAVQVDAGAGPPHLDSPERVAALAIGLAGR